MAVSNTMGTQIVWDGEVPRTFTATAAEVISGGEYIVCSGATSSVGSSISTFADGDIVANLVTADAVGVEKINGIALNVAASGALVTVATRGAYLVQAGGSVLVGYAIEAMDEELIQSLTSGTVPTGLYTRVAGGKKIGRALTAGVSGTTDNYCLVYFNF